MSLVLAVKLSVFCLVPFVYSCSMTKEQCVGAFYGTSSAAAAGGGGGGSSIIIIIINFIIINNLS